MSESAAHLVDQVFPRKPLRFPWMEGLLIGSSQPKQLKACTGDKW